MTTPATMKTIICVRIALVVRGAYYDNKNATVLLPGSAGTGSTVRYVLAPAGMTGAAVKSANAQLNQGQSLGGKDFANADPGGKLPAKKKSKGSVLYDNKKQ